MFVYLQTFIDNKPAILYSCLVVTMVSFDECCINPFNDQHHNFEITSIQFTTQRLFSQIKLNFRVDVRLKKNMYRHSAITYEHTGHIEYVLFSYIFFRTSEKCRKYSKLLNELFLILTEKIKSSQFKSLSSST